MNLFKYVAINFIIAGTVFAEANTQHQEQQYRQYKGEFDHALTTTIFFVF